MRINITDFFKALIESVIILHYVQMNYSEILLKEIQKLIFFERVIIY